MWIINPKFAATHSVKFFSENNFIFAAAARAAMSTEINIIPGIVLADSPKIFRLIRIFYGYEGNAFALEFKPIIYFIFPTRTIVPIKFDIFISYKSGKFQSHCFSFINLSKNSRSSSTVLCQGVPPSLASSKSFGKLFYQPRNISCFHILYPTHSSCHRGSGVVVKHPFDKSKSISVQNPQK